MQVHTEASGEPKAQLLIGAPSSNSGKTTITLGLLRAFQKRGLKVQPFKCGPDYIDPKFHEAACGTPSVNLDLVMMPPNHLKATYQQYAQAAAVAVTEGVMGLFDGAVRSEGSTASLSKVLDIPVLLVVDAKATAYSVAPLLYGFKNFDPALKLGGVIFNRVGSSCHYQLLKEACEEIGIPALGYLPNTEGFAIPSRHLGLSLGSLHKLGQTIDYLAEKMEETVAIDQVLQVFQYSPQSIVHSPSSIVHRPSTVKVAVARDEAFNFTYMQNLKKLEEHTSVRFFSPLEEKSLPEANLLYLPGGYPELYAKKLAGNIAMRKSIQAFISAGGSVLAECGGLMYLGETLTDKAGQEYEMVGALPLATSMEAMKLTLGYRKIRWGGQELIGHEFHYSSVIEKEKIPSVGEIYNMRGQAVNTRLYQSGNILASYIHLYFGDDRQFSVVSPEGMPLAWSVISGQPRSEGVPLGKGCLPQRSQGLLWRMPLAWHCQ